MNLKQRDRKYLGRDDEPDELQIVRADAMHLIDARGRKFIDFSSGWCVGNLGWGHAEIRRAIRNFRGPAYVTPSYLYAPWAELAELLASIAPGKLTKCFRATGGSEAVDFALQAAMLHTGRGKFLSFEESYHGDTFGALSVGASENRERLPNLLANCTKVQPPLDERALATFERHLRKRDVAAVIMEPISINLGVLIPSPDCLTRLQALCRRTGTLLIMDEVAAGFGRTGKLFATERFAIDPDMLCLAKALTGGFAPMGALLTTKAVAESMEEDGSFYSTFGWHPLSTAVAIANVRCWKQNERRILAHVARLSALFRDRLAGLKLENVKATRIEGLAIAIEFDDEETAPALAEGCRERGLIVTDAGASILMLLPPLNLPRALATRGLDILEKVAAAK
jgi:acetylornithine/succinyldiaminopimelate/putrescine aminotransferase